MAKDIPCKWKPKESRVVLDKIGFNPKTLIRDKNGHYIMMRKLIHQEDMTIINILIYALNIRAPIYIKQILQVSTEK